MLLIWLLRATFGKKKQFYWWKKSEYTVKITELSQATDILYDLNLYLVHLELTNNSDVKRWLYRYKCIWICKPSYHAILGTMMVLYSLSRTSKSIVYVKVISELVKNVVKLVISCNVFLKYLLHSGHFSWKL